MPEAVASASEDEALDVIDRQLDRLHQKVDAIMVVMTRRKP